jgi:hypothetical protein
MPESGSNQQVIVTAEERAHPAILKLARACIALARDQLHPVGSAPTGNAIPTPAEDERRAGREQIGGQP